MTSGLRVVASIEARMGSTRLPGKSLADVGGKSALSRLLSRLVRCRRLDGIVLATSTLPADDALEQWARRHGTPCYRGSEEDVLARVAGAHRMMGSDVVVEICGDMPLLDPELVDRGVEAFFEGACDVVTTVVNPSYPMGVDVQVFRRRDLEWVERSIVDPEVREHVSLYFYQHPEKYRIIHLDAPQGLRRPQLRLVLDTAGDLETIRDVWARLEPLHGDGFSTQDIVDLLEGRGGPPADATRKP